MSAGLGEQVQRTTRSVERLPVIDLLRGVAALAVVTVHLPFSWSASPTRVDPAAAAASVPGAVTAVTDYGRFGVHLFLIISGFCIHLRVARGGGTAGVDFVRFWRRRLTRLYPPYAVAVFASIIGLLVLFGVIGGQRTWPAAFGYDSSQRFLLDVLQLLTLTQNLSNASQRIGNGSFWTLALEEQLYLLYFLLLLLRRRWGWPPTLVTIGAVTFVWRALPLVLPGLPGEWNILGPARWLEWALGALAVEGFLGVVRLPTWTRDRTVALGAGATAVVVNVPVVLTYMPWLSVIADAAFGLAFFLLVNWSCAHAAVLRARPARALAAVGLFSYSLYLTHEPVLVAAKQLLLRLGLGPGGPGPVLIVLASRLLLALAVGYIFYRLIEVRSIEASRRLRGPARPSMHGRKVDPATQA